MGIANWLRGNALAESSFRQVALRVEMRKPRDSGLLGGKEGNPVLPIWDGEGRTSSHDETEIVAVCSARSEMTDPL